MKTEIIRMLKDCDGYLSGQELCRRLSVSRTAVWKVIRQLQEEGYRIEAVPSKGYRLLESADVLTKAELESCMMGRRLGGKVFFYEKTDSTNCRARELAEQGVAEGTLAAAECQEAGKGRRGRSWSSPPGTGIWMSLVLRPELEPSRASMLTLTAALAVTAGIRKVCGLEPQIKWPNDIVLSGKKVCGILTEMSTELEAIRYVILGIGINVNMEAFPEEIAATATSLFFETGTRWKRSELIAAVMQAMEGYYGRFLQTGDLSGLMDEYMAQLANQNRQVQVLAPAGAYGGICRGINAAGELLVEREDGTVEQVMSGEVSVRGIYGYV